MMGEMSYTILNPTNVAQSHLMDVLSHHSIALLHTGLAAFEKQAGIQIPSRL